MDNYSKKINLRLMVLEEFRALGDASGEQDRSQKSAYGMVVSYALSKNILHDNVGHIWQNSSEEFVVLSIFSGRCSNELPPK